MCAGGDLVADRVQMQRHGLGIGCRHDKTCRDAPLGTGGTEEIGPVITPIAGRAWPRAAPGPDTGQRALLADPRFVLEPDFDRLALGVAGERRRNGRGKVFLNAC
jgi:hypothetical protein